MWVMRRLIKIFICFSFLISCSNKDYSQEIIGKWKLVDADVEFTGTPDKNTYFYIVYADGIEFKENNFFDDYISNPDTINQKFNISAPEKYELNGENLIIGEKKKFKIVSLENGVLKMDHFLTLKDCHYNYGYLEKLRKQGTDENLIVHYTFERDE